MRTKFLLFFKPYPIPRIGTLTLGLLLSSGLSIVSPVWGDQTHGGHSGNSMTDTPNHGHEIMEIPAGQPVPTITIVVQPDPVDGWNLEIQTTNFRFAPEHVNQVNQPNEGHGHLYINGEKVSRVYSNWLHIADLPSGRNEITVGLNGNNHAALAQNGEKIEATVIVEVP